MKTFIRFYQFCFKYPVLFAGMMFFVIVVGVAESVLPIFYRYFIDAVTSGNTAASTTVLALYIGVRFFILIFGIVRHYLSDLLLIRTNRDAYLAVFHKVQLLDFSYQINRSTGSLISAIKRGDSAFFGIHTALNSEIPSTLVTFSVLFVSFLFIDLRLLGILMITLVVQTVVGWVFVEKNVSARRTFNVVEDRVSGIVVDTLLNFETVKYFAKEMREFERLKTEFVSWAEKIWKYAFSFYYLNFFTGLVGTLGLVTVLGYAVLLHTQGSLSVGELVMVIGFMTTFYDKMFRLLYQLRDVFKLTADMERFFAVLDEKETVVDPATPVVLDEVRGEIVFSDVHFSYPEGKEHALHNLSLTIRAGESVAFVGPSGAGKTTLIKLLLRLYDPTSGSISIDGVGLDAVTKSHLRSHMGVVPQEPVLFNNSIAFNIGYALDTFSQKAVEHAAQLAQLHDFILTLPEGYETKVGERGVKLSGGQKQRLAIARMLLSDPDIIIFDEATSQLDSESEELIQKAFWKAAEGKTTLIIAHRLSTIKKVDTIVVIDDGKIIEIGSHAKLLEKAGKYKRLWELQAE